MSEIPVRQGVQSKQDIEKALRDSYGALANWIESQPDAKFTQGPDGRWSMGQHLEHLNRSIQPFTLALSLPGFLLGLALPKMNRPSMSYEQLAAKYEAALDAGGKSSGRYNPPAVPLSRKKKLLATHRALTDKLLRQINRLPEEELDRLGAKHPLIGVLSMRELFYFTAHHHDHHLHTLQRDYGQ